MDGTCTIREAAPTDAAGFARSQISAWRAAYEGILPAAYLAGMDVERLTAGWERRLAGGGAGVRQLALCADGRPLRPAPARAAGRASRLRLRPAVGAASRSVQA